MMDVLIDTAISTCCTSKAHSKAHIYAKAHIYDFSNYFSSSLPFPAAAFTENIAVSDTPLSPSHAGDKGYNHQPICFSFLVDLFANSFAVSKMVVGLRPVDKAVLPRPSFKEEGKAALSAPSKECEIIILIASLRKAAIVTFNKKDLRSRESQINQVLASNGLHWVEIKTPYEFTEAQRGATNV